MGKGRNGRTPVNLDTQFIPEALLRSPIACGAETGRREGVRHRVEIAGGTCPLVLRAPPSVDLTLPILSTGSAGAVRGSMVCSSGSCW
jgi:hypothetical protein